MNIIIKETGENTELVYTMEDNGINYASDLLGSYGILEEPEFTYVKDSCAYLVTQETFDHYMAVLQAYSDVEREISKVKENYGDDLVEEYLMDVAIVELEEQPAFILDLLEMIKVTENATA